jgi:small-conductance mechanosensitive channel
MFKKRKSRTRKSKMHSYRQLRQVLLAFGLAGLVMGMGLIGYFGFKRNVTLAGVGAVYVLVSMLLLGLRGVLTYMGDINRQRRFNSQSRRVQQT